MRCRGAKLPRLFQQQITEYDWKSCLLTSDSSPPRRGGGGYHSVTLTLRVFLVVGTQELFFLSHFFQRLHSGPFLRKLNSNRTFIQKRVHRWTAQCVHIHVSGARQRISTSLAPLKPSCLSRLLTPTKEPLS